ncbi:hypothetical protein LCGC14_2933000, partial [marine sediment metagenome]
IDMSVKRDCTTNELAFEGDDICRINNISSTLLSNGRIITAAISTDKSISDNNDPGYNKGRVFIFQDESSINSKIINIQNVIIPPKSVEDSFDIFVKKDIYDRASQVTKKDLFVIIFNQIFNYKKFKVAARGIDEYSGFYFLTLTNIDNFNPSFIISQWYNCELTVFFEETMGVDGNLISPEMSINLIQKMPYISDENNNVIDTLSVSISSNIKNIGNDDISYVYLVAEAILNSQSQLFYYSFSIGESDSDFNSFGWKQLTFDGNNK